MFFFPSLILISIILLVSSITSLFVRNIFFIRFGGLICSLFLFCWSFELLLEMIQYAHWYEGIFAIDSYLKISQLIFNDYSVYYLIDSLSISLIFLTNILLVVCIILSRHMKKLGLLYSLLFLVIYFLIMCFCVMDVLFFYIFSEAVLIPMYLIIGIWGSRSRKVTAAYRLFLYTVIGSITFSSVILYWYNMYGTTLLYDSKYLLKFDDHSEVFLWLGLFIALGVKVPIYPVHVWLPEAHAEAPTIGSVLLAGILLKLGPYGLIRFTNFLLPYGMFYWRPLIYLLCLNGLYYTTITAIRQTDIKKIIAYSSIGHMALALLGIFTLTVEGFLGGFILLIAHGFIPSGLFLSIGLLYERLKTRVFFYYKGLVQIYPFLSIFLFLLILGNIGFPGTLNFIAEVLIIIGLVEVNSYVCILVIVGSIIVLGLNLHIYGKIFYGAVEMRKEYILYNKDLNFREICSLVIVIIPTFLFGIVGRNLVTGIEKLAFFYCSI